MDKTDAPVFIKLDEYKDIIDIVTVLKKKLAETRNTLERIKQIKAEEDAEIENWESNLEDVHQKLEFIDDLITKPNF